MDTIQSLWQRIEKWVGIHAPGIWQELLPGASEADIRLAETVMEMTLPEDFKASYRLHNGGYTLDLITEMRVMPLQEIVTDWRMLKELLEVGNWDGYPPAISTQQEGQTDAIQPTWWHLKRVPFGIDRAGNYCCLDLSPAPNGTIGQVIDWDHEIGPTSVTAASFHELLAIFADDLEAGMYAVSGGSLIRREQN